MKLLRSRHFAVVDGSRANESRRRLTCASVALGWRWRSSPTDKKWAGTESGSSPSLPTPSRGCKSGVRASRLIKHNQHGNAATNGQYCFHITCRTPPSICAGNSCLSFSHKVSSSFSTSVSYGPSFDPWLSLASSNHQTLLAYAMSQARVKRQNFYDM